MKRIAIALTNDFADWECALVSAAARSYLGAQVTTASPDGNPVTSMGGLKVLPDCSYSNLKPDDFDALLIPGGLSWEKGTAPDFSRMINAFQSAGKVVGGICAAASAVAGSGAVNTLRHTGNSLESHQKYAGYKGEALFQSQAAAVQDGGIVTAPGTAPITFAAEVMKALGLWVPEAEAVIAQFAGEHLERAPASAM
ncbi:DJ-1/PfpI family protein [Roseibium litorale]|uniref:DJ-1/PfpI family protein n=1 Tax=Roseibium litorale TaxID=2803841 RepID=A0ABR9CMC7_9HYPH|nr:DJ-1/PfpI family protein [Roseibium litorale]MBD8891749.1 DJ-1/PfpI family protein [Roseibium litorale]